MKLPQHFSRPLTNPSTAMLRTLAMSNVRPNFWKQLNNQFEYKNLIKINKNKVKNKKAVVIVLVMINLNIKTQICRFSQYCSCPRSSRRKLLLHSLKVFRVVYQPIYENIEDLSNFDKSQAKLPANAIKKGKIHRLLEFQSHLFIIMY